MKRFTLTLSLALLGLAPLSAQAVGFMNSSFEDPTKANFWECNNCQDAGNYVVANSAAIDGNHFAVVLNGIAMKQTVDVPTKGDTTRLTFWYRNTGNTKVIVKRNGRVIERKKLKQSENTWKKMKVDNIPQKKNVTIIIKNGGDGYTFFDDFRFRKRNRQRVKVRVTQDGEKVEDAKVKLLSRKRQKVKRFRNKKNKKVYSVRTGRKGVAQLRINPSDKKFTIRVSKDGVSTTVNFKNPKANRTKTKRVTLPIPEELLEEESSSEATLTE
jgi:hypothetical protein